MNPLFMMQPTEIERILKKEIPGAEVSVKDLTGGMDHFEVLIVADQFKGLGMVQQHQLVYKALKEQMVEAIHALTIRSYTPEDFARTRGAQPGPKGIS